MADFICILSNLFRFYLIGRFMQSLFGKQERKAGRTFAYVLFFLANSITFLFFHTAWINVLCNLLGFIGITRQYTKSAKLNLFVTATLCLLHMGSDIVVTYLFMHYEDGVEAFGITGVLSVFLILAGQLLVEKLVSLRGNSQEVPGIPLIFVPLCSIAMLLFLLYVKENTDTILVVIGLGLLSINFFICYLFQMLSDAYSSEYENRILRQKTQSYASQMELMRQGEERIKALRHDMKHHMGELKLLAEKNENSGIKEYIEQMEEFMENPGEEVSSGNLEMDSVLNYLIQRAKQELEQVKVKVQIPGDIQHSFDINVILGNLMENAIEAAGQTKEKTLELKVWFKKGTLRMEIKNSFNGKLNKKKQEFLTTKEDREEHGIGLKNVRKIVEKYNGIMKIDAEDHIFSVKLVLYLST